MYGFIISAYNDPSVFFYSLFFKAVSISSLFVTVLNFLQRIQFCMWIGTEFEIMKLLHF